MKKLLLLCAAFLLITSLSTHAFAQAPEKPINTSQQWGVTLEWNDTLENFQTKMGGKTAVKDLKLWAITRFMGNPDDPLGARVPADLIPFVFLEPTNWKYEKLDDPRQAEFAYQNIIDKKWDDYFTKLAEEMRDFKKPVIFIPFPEMNGSWLSVSVGRFGNTTEGHKKAYERIRFLFKEAKAHNVQFGWCINHTSHGLDGTPPLSAAAYYPGENLVDLVIASGFGWSENDSYEKVFGEALRFLKTLNKPIYLNVSCVDGKSQSKCTKEMLSGIQTDPQIAGFLWFSIIKYEQAANRKVDWRPYAKPETKKEFLNAIQKYKQQ